MRASVSGSPVSAARRWLSCGEVVEQRAALDAVDAGRVVQIEDRVRAGAEADALVRRGEEAAAPEAREDRLARVLAGALRDHGDERGQVFVHAAEAVADPRAHAGVAGLLVAGVDERDRRVVVDRLGVHRLDDADVVGDRLHVRQQVADPGAVLAAAAAGPHGGDDREAGLAGGHAGEALLALDRGGQILAVDFWSAGL